MKKKQVINKRFGRLLIIAEAPKRGKKRYVLCQCDCGSRKEICLSNITSGKVASCKCLHKEIIGAINKTHGMTHSREFHTWVGMKARCLNPENPSYKNYGGRGITICDKWLDSFENFLSDMGPCPQNYSLDRIDVNGNYNPENCRWADNITQSNNKRTNIFVTVNGEELTLTQACQKLNLSYKAVHQRMRRGQSIYQALNTATETATQGAAA